MCKAIEDMKTDAERRGIEKGIEKGIKKGEEKKQNEMIAAFKASGASDELIQNALKYMEQTVTK